MTAEDRHHWSKLVEGDYNKECFIQYKIENETLKSVDLAAYQYDIHENCKSARTKKDLLPFIQSKECSKDVLLFLITDFHKGKVSRDIINYVLDINCIPQEYVVNLISIQHDEIIQHIISISRQKMEREDIMNIFSKQPTMNLEGTNIPYMFIVE